LFELFKLAGTDKRSRVAATHLLSNPANNVDSGGSRQLFQFIERVFEFPDLLAGFNSDQERFFRRLACCVCLG